MKTNMKCLTAFFIAVSLLLSLAACVVKRDDEQNNQELSVAKTAQKEQVNIYHKIWYLSALYDEKVSKGDGGKPVSLLLNNENNKASGFSGCNNYFSIFSVEQSLLTFGALAMTRKYCKKQVELEAQFARALKNVKHFEIKDNQLVLRDQNKKVVALFTTP